MNLFTFQIPDYKKWLLTACVLLVCPWWAFAEGETKPLLALNCPDDILVNSNPGECGINLNLNDYDWTSTQPVADTAWVPGNPFYFTYGPTTVTLTITDINGNMASCNFMVFVQQPDTPLECVPEQFIYIADSCYRELTINEMLVGGPYGCNDGYEISIISFDGEDLGNKVYPDFLGDAYIVKVTDIFSSSFCTGVIIVSLDSLPQSITCPPDITVRCHEPTLPPGTGYPEIETCFDSDSVAITYTDMPVNTFCDGDNIAFVINRTWKVTNPYNGMTSCVQKVRGRRVALNEIVWPPSRNGVDLPPLPCSDSLSLDEAASPDMAGRPLINGFDPEFLACNLTFQYHDTIEHICGASYEITRYWQAHDYCLDLMSNYVQTIIVEDVAGPVFQVPDTILVSTSTECSPFTSLPPIDLIHECSFFSVEIQTPWGFLQTNGGPIQIPQVPGIFKADYIATDTCGNTSMETSTIHVTDGIFATCPEPAWVDCIFFSENLEAELDAGNFEVLDTFGLPTYFANCMDDNVEVSVEVDVNSCGEGLIQRTFSLDLGGIFEICVQNVRVETVSQMIVQFPPDTVYHCDASLANFGEPLVIVKNCEQPQTTFTDEIIDDVAGGCYKILRTWVVANTCVTGALIDQEIEELSEDKLGLPFPECDLDGDGDCDSLTFRDSWTDVAMPGPADANSPFSPDTDPDSDPWDGYLTYVQEITVFDTVAPVFDSCHIPDVCITGNTCKTNVMLPVPVADDCQGNLTYTVVSDLGIDFGPFNNVNAGSYDVTYFAIDPCGNQSLCETTVKVVDCAPPTPVCSTQVILNIPAGPQPTVNLFAPTLNIGSFDNCTMLQQYSFSADTDDQNRTFTCDDVGQNQLLLIVTDLAGNQSSCDIFVVVQDPTGQCGGGSPTIAGNIFTELDSAIVDVVVASSQGYNSQTDADGLYQLQYDNGPNSVSIEPLFNENFLNGVTTFDAVLIIKHVLGSAPLDSPYKIIAGDVNHSNSVTTFDAVEIRRLVLGITLQFPNNTSWRFVPADFVFPNPLNPLSNSFPEFAVAALPPTSNTDFIGIKIGDVNGTVNPGLAGGVDDRNPEQELIFSVPNVFANAGQHLSVPVHLPSEALLGSQFALGYDTEQLELLEVEPGIFDENCFGKKHLDKGVLLTSWVEESPLRANAAEAAFTLHFLVKKTGEMADLLWLDAAHLQAEAYTSDLNVHSVQLAFSPPTALASKARLMPNRPDPFAERTLIPFELPLGGIATFHFFDAAGRQVKSLSGNFAEGYHELEIRADELPGPGIYFYQMRTEHGTDEGKMVRQ